MLILRVYSQRGGSLSANTLNFIVVIFQKMMFSPPKVLILLSFLFLYATAQDVESFRLILTDLILPDYIPTQVFYFFPNCDINQN